ncbi:hypothetical protein Q73A0000_09585 [Kaistella flava (ex Peng et al. 2021)]|uniref:KAP NTPase domain-containing protein n=1 Tax=Kaistella flava (ex Peng et al. 2021) TaxID=2038776 RepID=A0A7M2YAD9_9FLAO|nr:P-loop NTPase fold protein [Kaistella flava (ex Peng et al. 2021)]QOW10605.1 hypothetical protein Q73A0000_09585 [Kaistella flava (ex Peng et al. 2021)]
MEGIHIESVFKNYLQKEKTDYSLLINGEWGSGKTFFFKNRLTNIAAELKYKTVYLSLNGITSIDTIDYNLKIKLIPFLNKLDVKKAASIGNLAKNVLFQLVKGKYDIDPDKIIKDVEFDITNFEKNVFVFDDLERCNVKLSEVLGYVNDLVEHKNCKVVFLSDESKIKNDLTKDSDYNTIKEKVIGRVLNFENKLHEIIPMLFEKYESQKDFYKFLSHNESFIRGLFEEYNIKNLRNISFYIDVISNVFPSVKNHNNLTAEILLFSLIITNEFKSGKLTSSDSDNAKGIEDINPSFMLFNFSNPNSLIETNDLEREKTELEIFYEKYLTKNINDFHFYKSIYQFILSGFLDIEILEDELNGRYPEQATIESTVFTEVFNYNFRDLENSDFIVKLGQGYEFAKQGKYNIYDYLQISRFLKFYSTNNLFYETEDNIQKSLFDGIQISKKREEYNSKLFNSIFHFQNKDDDPYIVDLIKQVHNSFEEKNTKEKTNELIKAINANNDELLEEVFKNFQVRNELFLYTDENDLFEALISCKNTILTLFTLELRERYNFSNVKEYLTKDFDFLNKLNKLFLQYVIDNEKGLKLFLIKQLSEELAIILEKIK